MDIEGNDRANVLRGGNAADEIRGRGGNDQLFGLGGNDRLRGDEGDDILDGGAGDDRLRGDKGDDLLTGGEGRDRFIFNTQGGRDVVTDYTDGVDRIDLTNFGFASVDDALDGAAQVGPDVVFTFGAVLITLEDVRLSSLGAGDFIL